MENDYVFQLEMRLFDLNSKYERRPSRILENQIAYYTALLLEEERHEREINEVR